MTYVLNGRRIVYTNQVPYEEDVLATNNYNMVNSGGLAETIIGFGISNSTTVRGLNCVPVSPPGLAIVIGPGVMYSYEDYDATNYSVIPADTDPNHKLYKQAFNWEDIQLPVTAPATPGDSVIYLIEGIFATQDVNNVSRPYFNSSNPQSPIFNNNFDTRTDTILFQAIAGTPSPTPTPPSPTAGYTGLWHVTVANGQTVITGGDIQKISTIEGQPFITEGLTEKVSSATVGNSFVSIPAQQAGNYIYANDVGSINALVANPAKSYTSYTAGMIIDVLVSNSNTGSSTLNVSGNGVKNIVVPTQTLGIQSLIGGELIQNSIYTFQYNGTEWLLKNPSQPLLYGQVTFQSATTQIIPQNSITKIDFDNVLYDSNGLWNAGSFEWVLPVTGKFQVTGICYCDINENDSTGIFLYKNGSFFRYITLGGGVTPPTAYATVYNGSSGIFDVTNGDTIALYFNNENVTNPIMIGARSGINGDKNLFEIRYIGR